MNTKQLSNEGRQIKHEKGGKKTRKLADREVEGGGGKGEYGRKRGVSLAEGGGGVVVRRVVVVVVVQVLSPEEQIEAT